MTTFRNQEKNSAGQSPWPFSSGLESYYIPEKKMFKKRLQSETVHTCWAIPLHRVTEHTHFHITNTSILTLQFPPLPPGPL